MHPVAATSVGAGKNVLQVFSQVPWTYISEAFLFSTNSIIAASISQNSST